MNPLDNFLKKDLNKEINSLFMKQPPTPPEPRNVRGDYSQPRERKSTPSSDPTIPNGNNSVGFDSSLSVFGLIWFGLGFIFGVLAMLLYFS